MTYRVIRVHLKKELLILNAVKVSNERLDEASCHYEKKTIKNHMLT